jgi:hypothetical protein
LLLLLLQPLITVAASSISGLFLFVRGWLFKCYCRASLTTAAAAATSLLLLLLLLHHQLGYYFEPRNCLFWHHP